MDDQIQAEYESRYPLPANTVRCGGRYAATEYGAWRAHDYATRFEGFRAGWQAALSRRPAPVAVPDGWKMVPIEPTQAMCTAASEAAGEDGDHHEMLGRAYLAYRAMLAAAPSAPAAPAPAALEPVAWISTADQLPELDTPAWLYAPDVGTFFGMRESSTDGWGWVEGYGLDLCPQGGPGFTRVDWTDYEPTHWMPLPAAPGAAPPVSEQQECGCCGQTGACDPDCDCAEQPDTVPVPRDLLERAADRFSKAQIFDFSSELRALLEKEGAQP